MAVHSTRNSKNSTSTRRAIRGTSKSSPTIPMAHASEIPAGKYHSRIISVRDTKTRSSNKEAVEIVYELTSASGETLRMREVIPYDSFAYECFSDAMIAAGLEEDDDVKDAVGITERVTLSYHNPGGLGSFSKRVPVISKANAATDDDEEDEDNLSPNVTEEDGDDEDFLDFEED